MHIHNHHIKPEYQQVVMKVQHYINQNLAGDVSLETIARIANYSPFHFQKIFSEALKETPKQYVIRLRLERAAHFIKIFPNLAINEIASGCGFSSNSIFSRAFKNYYGISAEKFRELPSDKLQEVSVKRNKFTHWEETPWITPITDIQEKIETIKIYSPPAVSTMYPFKIACIQTTLSHKENISFAFKSLLQWAVPRELVTTSTKYFGIWLDFPFITPSDKCRFLCGIEIGSDIQPSNGISIITFNKGQYINYEIIGDINETLGSLVALNHNYIDSMGYSISEMICYEQLSESPVDKPYEKILRNLLIPVKIK
ncbi:MAG: AraC family transcriptional regulator [Bacteroidales bacterium]|nr:AraC family transcriptional regulator [Bacteroidales bacterium]